jgi:hypothetical protein
MKSVASLQPFIESTLCARLKKWILLVMAILRLGAETRLGNLQLEPDAELLSIIIVNNRWGCQDGDVGEHLRRNIPAVKCGEIRVSTSDVSLES